MFERYTEKARRTIFFARYEASQFGADCVETEHLLLGLLREDKALTNSLSINSIKYIHQRVRPVTPVREKISTSVDLPLSHESKRVLAYSAEEAERLGRQSKIGPEHMLLGLLREEKCLAASLLQERGLSIVRVRAELAAAEGDDSFESVDNALQTRLLKYLESLPSGLGVSAAGPDIYVSLPSTAPFLLIEILSPTDRFAEVRHRIDEHLAIGLRYVWLFDPGTGHVYVATPHAGLYEFKGDVLRTEDPVLELPLTEVFS